MEVCPFIQALSRVAGLLLILSLAPLPAVAKDASLIMTYDVYAGGIHALDARLVMSARGNSYDLALSSATHGLLRRLAAWSGVFTTSGRVAKDGVYNPRTHISRSTWKDETEEKTYKYDGKGGFISYKVKETKEDGGHLDKTPERVPPELTRGSTDLLSATYTLLQHMPIQKECRGESLIFDGDRNFRLVFRPDTKEVLKKTKYNIFEGTAVSCFVEVIPEKGKWRKKPRGWLSIQEQGRKIGSLPTIWLGQVDKDGPFIPVKIRVKTDYGTLFMHLTSYRNRAAK